MRDDLYINRFMVVRLKHFSKVVFSIIVERSSFLFFFFRRGENELLAISIVELKQEEL